MVPYMVVWTKKANTFIIELSNEIVELHMNTRKHMIIVKGEIQTSRIRSCKYNYVTKKTDIVYITGGEYSYAFDNVIWLKDPKVLNPKLYHVSREGRELFNIEEIYVFYDTRSGRKYWHICFHDESERDYAESELHIVESCLSQSEASNVFQYIKQIATLSNLKNDETGEKLLEKKFEQMDFVGKEVALAKYLNPSLEISKSKQPCTPIFPFGCNNSQYQAVKNAMENQISVIQGPPGTGKTQTILNIIANILLQGKTVQIVSNNNSATENVYEKLSSQKYNLGFIAATLGNSDNKQKFVQTQDENYPDFATWRLQEENQNIHSEIHEKSSKLKELFDKQEELAKLKQEQSQLETEYQYFKQYVAETDVDTNRKITNWKLSAVRCMELWQECQFVSEEKQKISRWFKIKGLFKYGIADFAFYKQDIAKIITTFQDMYYRKKNEELLNAISEAEEYLKGTDKGMLDDLRKQSMVMLKDILAKRYGGREKRVQFTEEDLWKNPTAVLAEYPVILSTTFSSRNSLSKEVVYDYLIMDEASQVDVATGALALSCARNVVIVGDTKQLPNVVTEADKAKAKAIFDSFQIHEGYQFTKSFLQSILDIIPNVTQTLLREHYRCHPKIINFCNQKFYRGELIIMTEDKGEEDVLAVVKTTTGNHVREHYSQRQIDVIKNEIIPKYVADVAETGIIAPYKNQVKVLEKEFKDIDAATVHKFQGKEKNTIIISTVDDEISDFADDPYLINVAVSRAKKKLILVVTGNEQTKEHNITDLISYIQYNNFEVTDSKIYSVFDYLYKQYTEARKAYLQNHKKVSEYDSENLMHALLEEILAMEEYSSLDVACHSPENMLIRNPKLLNELECEYAMHPNTHIDFLLYNRISKQPVLAIEVDGWDNHKEGTLQAGRDVLKDHILELYGIPLLRFKTIGSGEKERIIERLEACNTK